MKNNITTFYIVRHGLTEWNEKGFIQGHSDSPLTAQGITQVKDLAKKLKNVKFDLAFSSDLLRAMRTAEIIAFEHNISVQTSKLLRERDFGILEGKSNKNFKEIDELLSKLSDEERKSYKSEKYVESDNDISDRLINFLREIAIGNPGKKILIVTHGGIFRATLVKLGFGTFNQLRHGAVKNGGYAKMTTDGADIFIEETLGIEKYE